jgi:hypothetical protein
MTYQELKDIVGEGKPFLFRMRGVQLQCWGIFSEPVLWVGVVGSERPNGSVPILLEQESNYTLVDWFEKPCPSSGIMPRTPIETCKEIYVLGPGWEQFTRKCTYPPENFTINAIGCKCGGI